MSDLTWGSVPNTDAKASVSRLRNAVDVLAIKVGQASVRQATVSGWFEVADVPNPFTYEKGWLQVQVKCHWYGLKPETEWTHLKIENKYQLVRRYTGEVADNISS